MTLQTIIFFIFFAISPAFSMFSHPKVNYKPGPDVPTNEKILCRYPPDLNKISGLPANLGKLKHEPLSCNFKRESKFPCKIDKINAYKLITVTVKANNKDDYRCWVDKTFQELRIEDATLRMAPLTLSFNVYKVKY